MQPRRTAAFTLIELLVVVAIIALLISILLPTLVKARNQAKSAACLSNLKQIANGLQMYKDDNAGYFPGDHMMCSRTVLIAWVPRLWHRYLSQKRELFDCPAAPPNARWVKQTVRGAASTPPPAALIEMSTSLGYDNDEWPLMGDRLFGVDEYFSYGYNAYGGMPHYIESTVQVGLGGHIKSACNAGLPPPPAEPNNEEPEWEPHEKLIRRPADMIVIADAHTNNTWDTLICPEDKENFPGVRHNNGANVLFADSHANNVSFERLVKDEDVERRRWNRDFEPHEEWWNPDVPDPTWAPVE